MPQAAQSITSRRWHSPNGTACARLLPTVTSAEQVDRRTGKLEHAREHLIIGDNEDRVLDMGFSPEQAELK